MAIHEWLGRQEPDLYEDGIFQHVPRGNKCISGLGDYCEEE
jgi:hypothetical protein